MKNTQQFSLREYYLWGKSTYTNTPLPWKRFLNREFLNYERVRIKRLSKFRRDFSKEYENKILKKEASFYTIPIELSSSWKGCIAKIGNFNFIGLSALQNSPQVLMIAILPYTIKQPKDYRLINIKKSRKINLINNRNNSVEAAILIEDWEYLPSDKIYRDIPYEKKIIQNVFKENLIHDNQISSSFQAPIMSSPYVPRSIGGISLSSIAGDTSFSKELIKTVQLMVPPEYRGFSPPLKASLGSKFPYIQGINFYFSERPFFDNNFLSGLYDTTYSGLSQELVYRNKFPGEYSIFSTLNPIYGNVTQIWKELMKNFTSTEITLPQDLDELPYADVNLMKLKNVINEDLWIQIVHSRQINPSFNIESDKNFIDIINLINKDFDVILDDIYKQEIDREHVIKSMMYPTQYNLKRIAQSLARSEEKENLTSEHLKQARGLIIDNFEGFIKHPRFKKSKIIMEKKRVDARYSIIQTEIINNPKSSVREIYDSTKSSNLFKDIYDLQSWLDWLHEKGFVIIDINKRYIWVGKNP
jgi:hypothetical protein